MARKLIWASYLIGFGPLVLFALSLWLFAGCTPLWGRTVFAYASFAGLVIGFFVLLVGIVVAINNRIGLTYAIAPLGYILLVIGILVFLASLNTARSKAPDVATASLLNNIRSASAFLHPPFTTANSCGDKNSLFTIPEISQFISAADKIAHQVTCISTADSWAVAAPLMGGGTYGLFCPERDWSQVLQWCVDSAGSSHKITGELQEASCPVE